jgi:NAD(P)-dependent dehydrogenase (short-subunit alcohol dehydrogenase family)
VDRVTVEQTVAAIRDMGGDAHGFLVDVTDRASIQAMVEAVMQRYGRIDVLSITRASCRMRNSCA